MIAKLEQRSKTFQELLDKLRDDKELSFYYLGRISELERIIRELKEKDRISA